MESNLFTDRKWMFIKKNVQDAFKNKFKDDDWEKISIPHTWNSLDVQNGGGKKRGIIGYNNPGYYRGIGWYRLNFKVPKEYHDNRVFIRFEAAGSIAEVFLNEVSIGKHLGAFSAFCFELTDHVIFTENNILAVKVDNSWRDDLPPLGGDFPVMGGLYRPVQLIFKEKTCISPLDHASSGVYINQNKVSDNKAELELKVNISSKVENDQVIMKSTIFREDGTVEQELCKDIKILHGEKKQVLKIEISNPHLWNGLSDPYLYQVKVELIQNNRVIDQIIQPLGIRYYHVDPENGFFLNGKDYPIYGVNRHQDRLNKGWALSKEDQDEDLKLMLEMGVTAVRLAHYQHSEYFYSQCNKKGILVWAELSIVNKVKFSKRFFNNSKEMLIELIRQNYNHPSIFTWSLANEIGFFQLRSPVKIITKLNEIAHEEDPNRPTILAAISLAFFRKKLHRITDLIGWNHYPGWYYLKANKMGSHAEKFNKVGKLRGLCVSEYGAGASIYHHKHNLTHEEKVKAMGKFHPEEKQNIVHEETYRQMENLSFVWGTFLWNMFDFAVSYRDEGDTPGRNDKGLVTYDRKTKKDAYFFYKTNWSKPPIVYITSRRAVERKDKITDIKVYSNCEGVELRINGELIGMMSKEDLCIYRTLNCILIEGQNKIEVKGFIGDQKCLDSCTWNFNEISSS